MLLGHVCFAMVPDVFSSDRPGSRWFCRMSGRSTLMGIYTDQSSDFLFNLHELKSNPSKPHS
jgi:hypothetical protein